MQGRDLFGALVRAIGVYFIVRAAFDVFDAIAEVAHVDLHTHYSVGEDMTGFTAYLIPGVILLLCADLIVALAYRAKAGIGSSPDVGHTRGDAT